MNIVVGEDEPKSSRENKNLGETFTKSPSAQRARKQTKKGDAVQSYAEMKSPATTLPKHRSRREEYSSTHPDDIKDPRRARRDEAPEVRRTSKRVPAEEEHLSSRVTEETVPHNSRGGHRKQRKQDNCSEKFQSSQSGSQHWKRRTASPPVRDGERVKKPSSSHSSRRHQKETVDQRRKSPNRSKPSTSKRDILSDDSSYEKIQELRETLRRLQDDRPAGDDRRTSAAWGRHAYISPDKRRDTAREHDSKNYRYTLVKENVSTENEIRLAGMINSF